MRICHEIGHWICAGANRRFPEYGLGAGPDTPNESLVRRSDVKEVESEASILGIALGNQLGLGNTRQVLYDQNWFERIIGSDEIRIIEETIKPVMGIKMHPEVRRFVEPAVRQFLDELQHHPI